MFLVDVKTHRNFPAKLDYQAATVMVMFQLAWWICIVCILFGGAIVSNGFPMIIPFIQWFSHDPIDSAEIESFTSLKTAIFTRPFGNDSPSSIIPVATSRRVRKFKFLQLFLLPSGNLT